MLIGPFKDENFCFSTDNVMVYPYTQPETLLDGVEVRILREYATRYNITLNFTIETEDLGEIYPNQTGTGFLGAMVENRYDICIGTN